MKATPRRQRVAKRGVDCDRTQSLLRLAHFIQVPIRKAWVEKRRNRRVKVGGEKVTLSRSSSDSDTMRSVGVWWFSNWRKIPHTKTHVHAEWNPRELAGSDHNPLPPPPPTQGRTSQRPKWVGQFRPRTTTRIPIPSSSDFTFLLVSFYFFSPLLFLPLCLLLFCLFFFLS